jgi:hypothetical protein
MILTGLSKSSKWRGFQYTDHALVEDFLSQSSERKFNLHQRRDLTVVITKHCVPSLDAQRGYYLHFIDFSERHLQTIVNVYSLIHFKEECNRRNMPN